jgi:glycosyltransferase involved in cell wall biosynthesis
MAANKKEPHPIRVLYVCTAFPRDTQDSITPWLVQTIRRLRDSGIEVEVFTSSYKGLGDQVLWNIPVHRFRYFIRSKEDLTHAEHAPDRLKRGLIYKIEALFYMGMGFLSALRLAVKERYDVVHVHWPIPHWFFAIPFKLIRRSKIVSTFHSAEIKFARNQVSMLGWLISLVIRRSDSITANSTYTASELESSGARDVQIVPFGTTFESMDIDLPGRHSRTGAVLFVGRLVERKGVEYLLQAIHLLKSRDIRLHVVGDGPLRKTLEEKARELRIQAEFLGFVSREELQALFREADVFVLPAIVDAKGDTEGLGVVLIEALGFGKPVIASRVGGIPDIVIHEKTGLLVPEKDSEALASAIDRILENPDLAERLVRGGIQHVNERFSWPTIIKQLERTYEILSRYVPPTL